MKKEDGRWRAALVIWQNTFSGCSGRPHRVSQSRLCEHPGGRDGAVWRIGANRYPINFRGTTTDCNQGFHNAVQSSPFWGRECDDPFDAIAYAQAMATQASVDVICYVGDIAQIAIGLSLINC